MRPFHYEFHTSGCKEFNSLFYQLCDNNITELFDDIDVNPLYPPEY